MNSDQIIVSVSDFTKLPGARHRSDGDGSADEFFEEYLEPKLDSLKKEESLILDFDDTWGYASSFTSQLALRLYRKYSDVDILKSKIEVKSEQEDGLIKRFWDEVAERVNDEEKA